MIRTYASRVAAFVAFTMVTSLVLVMPATPAQSATTDLIISEYIEGTSDNKALEFYNGTEAAIDLEAGGYAVEMYFNGSTSAGLTIPLTGTVAPGDVHVIAHADAAPTVLAQADQTNGANWYNGDDAVVLRSSTGFVDSFGQVVRTPAPSGPEAALKTPFGARLRSLVATRTQATPSTHHSNGTVFPRTSSTDSVPMSPHRR